MKKTILSLVFLSALTLLLTGCVPGKVSRDQILEDIAANESFVEDYDMEIKDFSESQHETNKETGRDYVRALVTLENDYFRYQGSYSLYYVKYDDGWRLHRYDQDMISATAKVEMDRSRVKEDAREVYAAYLDQYGMQDVQLGDVEVVAENYTVDRFMPVCVYRIPVTGTNDFSRLEGQLVMAYQLGHTKGWYPVSNEYGYKGYETEVEILPTGNGDAAVAQFMEEEGMESYEVVSVEDNVYTLVGKDTDGSKYTTKYYDYEVSTSFDERTGWRVNGMPRKSLTDAEMHVAGTWVYDDGTGEQRYVIRVEDMNLKSITLSYDVLVTTYADGTYTRSSGGTVTLDMGVKSYDNEKLYMISKQDVAAAEDVRAVSRYIRLVFCSYGDERYEESGFWLNGFQLTKVD